MMGTLEELRLGSSLHESVQSRLRLGSKKSGKLNNKSSQSTSFRNKKRMSILLSQNEM